MKIKRFIALILILSLTATLFYFGSLSVLKTLYPCTYKDIVEEHCREYNLSPYFIYAVIECESGFDPEAVSHVGATGLMQIMPDTFAWISGKLDEEKDYSEAVLPEVSIKYGCYLYGYLTEKYKSEEVAIAAYHAGTGNVDKWLKDERYSADGESLHTIPFPTTAKYVKKVIKTKNIYEKLYDRKDA
ncbi:MAG: lytic transglycosylase domain-containing protein [Clostridia bacterium]|nr:lytic transglycosylase domain-containing protein [Clostridia bacterium]